MTTPSLVSESQPPRAGLRTILAFCAPTLGVGFMYFLVGLYMTPFATDVLLISPAAMGAIFMVSRLWDAFSDPIAGYLSDRTRNRLGRRRPWLAASILPIGVVYVMLWSPPALLEGPALTAWMALGVVGFYTAMTIFIVPHTALGAELTDSYHERTRIFGYRHVIWTIGAVVAVGGMQMIINAADSRSVAREASVAVALVTALLIGLAVVGLRERAEFQGRGGDHPFRSFSDIWRNPHARLLLIVFFIENLGAATVLVLTFYVAKYIVLRPDLTGHFILAYMGASIVFVGIWLPLSRRFGKKRLWIGSMLLTAAAFGGMFFLGEGRIYLISFLAVMAGTAAGCGAMVGPAIQADVIDYDEYMTGQRKEGAYFAAWNFVFKSSVGIMSMATLWVLEIVGFQPNVAQGDGVKLAIVVLYSIVPLVCYLIGAVLLGMFSLNENEHRAIRRALDERAATKS